MAWHRTMSRLVKRLTRTFGTSATLHFDGGPSLVLEKVVFDIGTIERDTEHGTVLVEAPRATVYREELPLVNGSPREPIALKDTIEIDDLVVGDGMTIVQGTYTIFEVRKDEGSAFELYLRMR